jgi:hypothetical protein
MFARLNPEATGKGHKTPVLAGQGRAAGTFSGEFNLSAFAIGLPAAGYSCRFKSIRGSAPRGGAE